MNKNTITQDDTKALNAILKYVMVHSRLDDEIGPRIPIAQEALFKLERGLKNESGKESDP